MVAIVGLDLAWTDHRPSGICIVEAGVEEARIVSLCSEVVAPGQLARELAALGESVVAAIDAPLVVEHGRYAERSLGRVFGRYHAGAYFASEAFLTKMNGFAGPLLAAALRAHGFELDPHQMRPGGDGRFAFEMYPHAAHIALFGLDHILRYKKGPVLGRREQLRAYQLLLAGEAERQRLDGGPNLVRVLAPAATEARGRDLKALEDELDAVTCALVALRAWRMGPAGIVVFGCALHGYIVTPGLPRGVTGPPRPCPTCGPAPTFP